MHRWQLLIQFRNPNRSVDTISYCEDCGIIRKEYDHASGEQVSPTYFGVGMSHQLDVPRCEAVSSLAALEARVTRLEGTPR